MQRSPITFGLKSVAHARRQVIQRIRAMEAIADFNLTQRYWYGATSTTATLWKKGKRVPFYFQQKAGTPYDAIAQMCNSSAITRGECLGAMYACVWWGTAQAMGPAQFNNFYAGVNPLNMDSKVNNSSIRNVVAAPLNNLLVPGDWVYWQNHNYSQVINNPKYKKYLTKSVYLWSGENALYVGQNASNKPTYSGLGGGLTGITNADLRRALLENYNADLSPLITRGMVPRMTPRRALTLIKQDNELHLVVS